MKQSDDARGNVVYVFTYKPDELSWRRIVFLPFNFYWRIFIALTGVLHCNLIIYEEVFMMDSYNTRRFQNIMTVWLMFYFVDLVLSLLHRVWESVQKSRHHQPKSLLALIIDVLSILPIRGFFHDPLVRADGSINFWKIWALNTCLRFYRIYQELFNLRQKMGLNPIVVSLIQNNVLLLNITCLLCPIWFVLGHVYRTSPMSWLSDYMVRNPVVDMNSPSAAYMITFMHVFVLLNNSTVMDIRAILPVEKVFCSALMYIGFLLRFAFMMATMVASFLQYQRHMYMIKDHIKINKTFSDKNKLHTLIEEYYVTYWNDWLGLKTCPMLNMFPLCLQKDMLTDMYWNAIEHSHLLRHFTINVKRQISLHMESKFMQPGDYIFRKGQVRNSFFYIASGVVQVMSFYDGISPIITISSGSCLGSLALVIPAPSPTDVICATECEVRVLTYKGYFTALACYRDAAQVSYETARQQIAHAKLVYTLSKTMKVTNPVMVLYGVPQDDQLKWIKRRWRTINSYAHTEMKKSNGYKHRAESTGVPVDICHTSKYLDLLVLNSEVKWDANKCCYRTAFPYTLEANCDFVKTWHLFIVVLITIDCIIVAYSAAFMSSFSELIMQWDNIISFAYILDIYFQIITVFRSVEKTITEPTALVRHHLTDMTFIISILATFPICVLTRLLYPEETAKTNLYCLHRLFKLVRVYTYFKYQWGLITAKLSVTHVLKTIYMFAMIIHISACLAFIMSCRFQHGELVCIDNSWFISILDIPGAANNIYMCVLSSIMYVGELVSICGMDITMSSLLSEAVFLTIIVFIGRNILTFTFAELMSMWIMKGLRKLACSELISSFRTVMQRKALHIGLTNMVTKYLKLQWSLNYSTEQQLDSTPSLEIFCPIVVADRNQTIKKAMNKVEFFNGLTDEMFHKVHLHFRLYQVPKNYIFCRSGEKPSCCNILLNGCCNIVSMIKEDMLAQPEGRLMKPFESFSLLEILQNIESLHTTVSITVCEVATIEAEKLQEILFEDRIMRFSIRQAMPYNTKYLDIVVSKRKYRKVETKTPSFVPVRKQVPKTTVVELLPSRSLFNSLKLIFNPPYIINPSGRFAYIWEAVKVTEILVTLFYLPFLFLFLCTDTTSRYSFALFLYMISFTDVYLRFFLGYYDSNGVLVRRASYYLSHAFAIDLIASLPMAWILYGYDAGFSFFATLFTKMLQIYRVSGFILAVKYRFKWGDFSTTVINFALHLVLIIHIMASCLYCYSCDLICVEGQVTLECPEGTWIKSNEAYVLDNPLSLILACMHISISILTGSDTGNFQVKSILECWWLVFFTMLAYIGKCYFMPRVAALLVGGNTQFTKHRENLKQFRLFIKNEGGDRTVASKIIDHFIYFHERLKGVHMQQLLTSLHPSISTDLSFALYYKGTKCLHKYVGESKSFMRIITRDLNELYFLKDSTIIRINELNKIIYFVSDGAISVFDEDGETIQMLKPGSMFGAMSPSGKLCHKYEYRSHINSCLLEIESHKFIKHFKLYNTTEFATFLALVQDKEYITVNNQLDLQHGDTHLPPENPSHNLLYKGSTFYQLIMFILSVIIPYCTVFPLLITILFDEYQEQTVAILLLYLFDFLMCLRIYVGLNTTYTDKQTGMYISNMRLIRFRYVTGPFGLILDVVSLFPVEIVWFIIKREWVNILRLNRMLRVLMMVLQAIEYRDTAFIRPWMRWFSYFGHVTMGPYIVVILWLYLTCRRSCTNWQGIVLTEPFEIFVQGLEEAIQLMTFSSSHSFNKPSTDKECILLIILIIMAYMSYPLLISGYTQQLDMANYTRKIYEYNMYCVKLYLQLRDLSNSLLEQLWDYSLLLWTTDRGQFLPKYLITAPSSLKCQLLYDLYGGHITYNVLFENCDHAFILQLMGYIKRTVYFPGDVIIRKYDVDGCMYFINSGEVEAVQFDELNKEVVEDVFITGQCFGLAEGLEERRPHNQTFIARNTVELLSLERADFMELLSEFPSNKKKIFRNAERVGWT